MCPATEREQIEVLEGKCHTGMKLCDGCVAMEMCGETQRDEFVLWRLEVLCSSADQETGLGWGYN